MCKQWLWRLAEALRMREGAPNPHPLPTPPLPRRPSRGGDALVREVIASEAPSPGPRLHGCMKSSQTQLFSATFRDGSLTLVVLLTSYRGVGAAPRTQHPSPPSAPRLSWPGLACHRIVISDASYSIVAGSVAGSSFDGLCA